MVDMIGLSSFGEEMMLKAYERSVLRLQWRSGDGYEDGYENE